jgi:hypothetical protein
MAFSAFKTTGIIIITVTWFTFTTCVNAQEITSSYLLPGIPQNSLLNPAFQNISDNLIIGIPLISGIQVSSNANITFSSLFSEGFTYSLERLYNSLENQGKISASADISMFFASLKKNDYTFSLYISEKLFSGLTADKEMVRLIRDGTRKYYRTNENFGKASINLLHYRQIAPGISKHISKKIDMGIRGKILFGKIYFNTKDFNITAETDPANSDLLIKPDGCYELSGPFRYNYNPDGDFYTFNGEIYPGDYFFQHRNLGLAFDAGIIFHPSPDAELSVSLTDFGFTTFKYNSYIIDFTQYLRYSENALYQSDSPQDKNYREPVEALKDFADSALYIMDVNESPDRFISGIPYKINISAKIKFCEKISGGIASQVYFENKSPVNIFSAFVNTSPLKGFEIGTGLSAYNFIKFRPGLGISHTGKTFQFFFSTNNILGITNLTKSKHINLHFGMNLLFDIKREENK